MGTLISITGGTLMILYKGPFVRKTAFSSSYHHLQLIPRLFIFSSTPEYWVLGGLFLVVASLSVSVWSIIQVYLKFFKVMLWNKWRIKINYFIFNQVETVKQYPEPMMIAALYSLMGTVQSTAVGLVAERNLSAWKLKLNMELLLILLSVSTYHTLNLIYKFCLNREYSISINPT